jgi:hypothetical protein
MTELFSLFGTIGAYYENCYLTISCGIFMSFNCISTFLLSSAHLIEELWLFATMNAVLSAFAYLFGSYLLWKILHERQAIDPNIINFAELNICNQLSECQRENINCEPPRYEDPPSYSQLSSNHSKIAHISRI